MNTFKKIINIALLALILGVVPGNVFSMQMSNIIDLTGDSSSSDSDDVLEVSHVAVRTSRAINNHATNNDNGNGRDLRCGFCCYFGTTMVIALPLFLFCLTYNNRHMLNENGRFLLDGAATISTFIVIVAGVAFTCFCYTR